MTKYKEGDEIVFRTDITNWDEAVNSSSDFSSFKQNYAGKAFTINAMSTARDIFNIRTDQQVNGYIIFKTTAVLGLMDEKARKLRDKEEKERKKKEAIEKAEKLVEFKKTAIWKIEDINKIAEDIFGPEKVQILKGECIDKASAIYSFKIDIHFPELDMTNSKRVKHHITDLYFRLNVSFTNFLEATRDDARKCSINPSGMRSSGSLKEYESHYSHSHLPSGSYGSFNNFCLGSSNFRILLENVTLTLSESDWYMMFLSIENYLKWESLEGGPYIRIASISSRRTMISQTVIQAELGRLMAGVPREIFGWNDGLNIITGHSELYDYFDKHSSIRSLDASSSSTTSAGRLKRYSDLITETLNNYKFNTVPVVGCVYVSRDKDESTNEKQIDKAVVDQFTGILTEKISKFNKNLSHEQSKRNSTTFRQVGIIE